MAKNIKCRENPLKRRAYRSKVGDYFHLASNAKKGEFFDTDKHPTFAVLHEKLTKRLEETYPGFVRELKSMGKVAPPSEIFISTHGFLCGSGFIEDGTLLLGEPDLDAIWSGTYLLHAMESLSPSDPREVDEVFTLMREPGILGAAARLFEERYGFTIHHDEPWTLNQPRPQKLADRFVEATNDCFIEIVCSLILSDFGYHACEESFRNRAEELIVAGDAFAVDRLLWTVKGEAFQTRLRTIAFDFGVQLARGYLWSEEGVYPSAQQRLIRIVNRIEEDASQRIAENHPFWRILCLGAALWNDHFEWDKAARSYRELFEAFSRTDV